MPPDPIGPGDPNYNPNAGSDWWQHYGEDLLGLWLVDRHTDPLSGSGNSKDGQDPTSDNTGGRRDDNTFLRPSDPFDPNPSPAIELWLKLHPNSVDFDPWNAHHNRTDPIIKDPQMGGPGYVGDPADRWMDKCPKIEGPCTSDQINAIKKAWSQAMNKIDHSLLRGFFAQGSHGCGDQMKNLVNCFLKALDTDFSDGTDSNTQPKIKINCDNTIPGPSQTQHKDSFEQINVNFKKKDVPLDAALLHELVHACDFSNNQPHGASNGELEANFFETMLYGKAYPFAVNKSKSDSTGDNDNLNWKAICADSIRVRDAWLAKHPGEKYPWPPTLVKSNIIAWDITTGKVYCLDSNGNIDYNNPLPNMPGGLGSQTNGLNKCW